MKILILQLARLGDVLQTWPAVRALRRTYPNAEIVFACRKKFVGALQGFEAIDRTVVFDTAEYFEPLHRFQPDVYESVIKLQKFCMELRNEKFDMVINFTFSPFSSYLTQLVCYENSQVLGYSRTSDGYLSIPDDTSAYVYAQIGRDRHNRVHLCDLFAMICNLDLEESDWRAPKGLPPVQVPGSYVVVHAGASQTEKMYSTWKWQTVIQRLLKAWSGSIVLVGSANEIEQAEKIRSISDDVRILNFVGKTDLPRAMSLIQNAKLLIGCDSAPLHMANLVGTKTLNISFKSVCYWETGPRVEGSYVLYADSEEEMPSDRVVSQVLAMLGEGANVDTAIPVVPGPIAYAPKETAEDSFAWRLLQAIYLGAPWPQEHPANFKLAVQRLSEMNTVLLEQVTGIQTPSQSKALMDIMDRGDEVIAAIGALAPEASAFVRWYQTEKIRIIPGSFEEILEDTRRIHQLFQEALNAVRGLEARKENLHETAPGN